MSHESKQVSDNKSQKEREGSWLGELGRTIALSIILSLGIRTFVAEARWIPTGSMLPTLQINDKLIIDKVSYRLHPPQREDIVVFMPPNSARICSQLVPSSPGEEAADPWHPNPNKSEVPEIKDAYIKRLIGVPGDKIQVTRGRVYINDRPLSEKYIADAPNYELGPITVPPNYYLMLGDNRNNSCDSHMWGFVPRDRIIGRAVVRFWPPNRIGDLN
jgi:signal peptidase I